jgi:catechol 2,3-dioxygenase-like lactoylglutathione lyase family enzyme
MYKALHISPMIPSYNLKETAAFFTDILGFTPEMLDSNYAVLHKDHQYIHVLPAGDIGEMEFYLNVDDVDGVWEDIKDKLSGMKVREPFDREYGMREIHIVIPHTKTLLFIGQAINR